MAITMGGFQRIAETVAERAAELLGTQVTVVDRSGVAVASNDARVLGLHYEPANPFLRMPLHLAGESGEIIIQEPANGEAISPRLAKVLAELIIGQAAVVDRLPNKHELKNKFIHDLLNGSVGDEEALFREAQILGMDLTHARVVILIDASDYILAGQQEHYDNEPKVRRRAQLVIGRIVDFFELPNDTICAYIGNGEVAVLKAAHRITWINHSDVPDRSGPSWANLEAVKNAGEALLVRLRSETRSSIRVGIGRYHPGLPGLARSYQDARAALSLGRRFNVQQHVHCLDSLGIAAFVGVSDERTKIELARYLLSPLDHEEDLLTTLDCFFEHDCCPSTTAQALYIHRNTLGYRLDKISSLTGLNPRRFDDAVQIRLALALRSLSNEPAFCATAQSRRQAS